MSSWGEKQLTHILSHRKLDTIHPGYLTVSAYANFYPVCYWDKTVIRGLDVDIINGFCSKVGLEPRYIEKKHFNDIWFDPSKGKSDISIGGIGVTDERTTAKMEWTIPYFYVYRTVIYNKDDPIKSFPHDVDGTVRGTVGSTGWIDAEEKLKKAGKTKYLEPGKTDEQDIQDLLDGNIQGLMRGSFVGKALVKKHKQLGMVKEWSIDPKLVSSDGECFAYPCLKGSGVSQSMSCYLTTLFLEGDLQALVKAYDLQ